VAQRQSKSGADWIAQLRDPDDGVAHSARLFLGGPVSEQPWMLPDLVEGTHSDDDYVRFWATIALVRLGTAAAPAGQRLRELLSDPDPAVRGAAVWAAFDVLPADEAVALLRVMAANDEQISIRRDAQRRIERHARRLDESHDDF
jgi:HEAT repeat protein